MIAIDHILGDLNRLQKINPCFGLIFSTKMKPELEQWMHGHMAVVCESVLFGTSVNTVFGIPFTFDDEIFKHLSHSTDALAVYDQNLWDQYIRHFNERKNAAKPNA